MRIFEETPERFALRLRATSSLCFRRLATAPAIVNVLLWSTTLSEG
jgi:hypothetical protein